MVRNSPTQVRQNADGGSIKSKRGHGARLRYVAGHYSTSQHNKAARCLSKMAADARKLSQMSLFSREMWL